MAYSDAITQTLKMTTNEERTYRMLDFIVIPIIFVVLSAAFHLHYMLTAGDWDFWVDWKDRLYWPIVSSISFVIIAGAIQGLLWRIIRMPIGMTLVGTGLVAVEWISRYYNFHLWAYFPMSQVWPATWIAVGIFVDSILLLTGSALMTSLFGVFFIPVIFITSNYPMLAPFRIPTTVMGTEVPVADWIGYVFQRGGSPEYLRIIEDAGLRVLGGETWFISCLFGGFVSIFIYLLWWWISGIAVRPYSMPNPLSEYMGGTEPDDKEDAIGVDAYPLPNRNDT